MRYGVPIVPHSDAERQRRRSRRRWARRSLELVLVAAALYLAVQMLSEVGWASLRRRVGQADISLLGLTTALLLARWLLWNVRWRLAMRGIGVFASRARTLFAILAAVALNHLTPSFRIFGGLVRARFVSTAPDAGFAAIYGSVLFDQVINQSVAGALSALAFIGLAWRLGRPNEVLAGALLVTSLILLVPLLHRHLSRRGLLPSTAGEGDLADRVGRRLRPLAERSRDFLASLQRLFANRLLLTRAVFLGLLMSACNLAAAWAAFAALGEPPPLTWIFFSVSLGVMIGALSGTPGGGLTTEAAMVTCYTLLGADRASALSATLLYRGLHYALVVLLGLPALITLETLYRRGIKGPTEDGGG